MIVHGKFDSQLFYVDYFTTVLAAGHGHLYELENFEDKPYIKTFEVCFEEKIFAKQIDNKYNSITTAGSWRFVFCVFMKHRKITKQERDYQNGSEMSNRSTS